MMVIGSAGERNWIESIGGFFGFGDRDSKILLPRISLV